MPDDTPLMTWDTLERGKPIRLYRLIHTILHTQMHVDVNPENAAWWKCHLAQAGIETYYVYDTLTL